MKRTIISIFCAVALFTSVDAQTKKSPVVFDSYEWDFGTIDAAEGTVAHTFTFTNTGNADLHILQVASGCGCTTPKYTKKPVKPGKKGSIKVEYDATGRRPGYFRKSVTVYSNDPSSYVRLFIEGIMVE